MPDLITLDFETYYDQKYSLSKLTTEEYVNDKRFEVIGVSVKVNEGKAEWASGTHEQIDEYLNSFDWANSVMLAHNTMFDGAIADWHFNVRPKAYADTLSLARALHGTEVGGSLAALVKYYGIGEKGTEIVKALGKRLKDFSEEELAAYGDYCINDTNLTTDLFAIMAPQVAHTEHRLIDITLRMFVDPILELDRDKLVTHLGNVKQHKQTLLDELEKQNVTKKQLMSNPQFAELLQKHGVRFIPKKVSPTTGKETFAFAKTDAGMQELQQHPHPVVQALVAARLGNKSTLEETRTERFLGIESRLTQLPIPLKYYAAHTGRWGGDDKINLQNLPSRGANGYALKDAIVAPKGYIIIDCDLSQVEARVLAWFARQTDLVEGFRNSDPVYEEMASAIFGVPSSEVTSSQRFIGKFTILGCGYGMGGDGFYAQLMSAGRDDLDDITLDKCKDIVKIYRARNNAVKDLWGSCNRMLINLYNGDPFSFGWEGVVDVLHNESALQLPSGLWMRYPDLQATEGEYGPEFTYKARYGRTKIYGGKVTENICQALARCIIGEQLVNISKRYKVALTVHDSIAVCVRERDAEEAEAFIRETMSTAPSWAEGLPLDCEAGVGYNYGEAARNAH